MDTSNDYQQVKHLVNHRLDFAGDDDGGDAVELKNVVLLAEGEWHDSLSSYPTIYTPENLAEFTVADNTGWAVHSFSRGLNEEIGEFTNPRYDASKHAILVDIFLHGLTQTSRDVIGAIRARAKRGQNSYVSVEMLTNDVMSDEGMVATNIVITGWVTTPNPACQKCRIPKQNSDNMTANANKTLSEGESETKPELTLEELLERIALLENRCDEFEKRLSADEPAEDAEEKTEKEQSENPDDREDEIKELAAKVAELSKALSDREQQIKALEEQPSSRVNVNEDTPSIEPLAEYTTRRL